MFSLRNKVIVVTGGNGLIGKELVTALRKNEAIVISADITFDEENVDNHILDITDSNSVKNGLKSIINKYGQIDGWVNNAYPRTLDWGGKFEDILIDSWRKNVDMHMNGYFLCCQEVLKYMKAQQFGSLINMSSIYGVLAPDFTVYRDTCMTMPAAYSAIKGGLINLTRYLASYYGEYNIRVNSVSPGGIFDNQHPTFVKNYITRVPMRRMGTVGDIVPGVSFLLSDASKYITGHNLVIDGGWSII